MNRPLARALAGSSQVSHAYTLGRGTRKYCAVAPLRLYIHICTLKNHLAAICIIIRILIMTLYMHVVLTYKILYIYIYSSIKAYYNLLYIPTLKGLQVSCRIKSNATLINYSTIPHVSFAVHCWAASETGCEEEQKSANTQYTCVLCSHQQGLVDS